MRAATDQYDASGLFVDDAALPPVWVCRCTVCGDSFTEATDDPCDTCPACREEAAARTGRGYAHGG